MNLINDTAVPQALPKVMGELGSCLKHIVATKHLLYFTTKRQLLEDGCQLHQCMELCICAATCR